MILVAAREHFTQITFALLLHCSQWAEANPTTIVPNHVTIFIVTVLLVIPMYISLYVVVLFSFWFSFGAYKIWVEQLRLN